jgi:hypothetical protein
MTLTNEYYTKDDLYEIWEDVVRSYQSNPIALASEAAEFLGMVNA